MLAGRGEAAAAVAVDRRHSELVPALGPQVGQEQELREGLFGKTTTRGHFVPVN